jgi:hypothetical protein
MKNKYNNKYNNIELWKVYWGRLQVSKNAYLLKLLNRPLKSSSFQRRHPCFFWFRPMLQYIQQIYMVMHFALHILVKDMANLQGSCLISLQEEMTYLKYILIEEMSFIGKKLLTHIMLDFIKLFLKKIFIAFGRRSIIWSVIWDNCFQLWIMHVKLMWDKYGTYS